MAPKHPGKEGHATKTQARRTTQSKATSIKRLRAGHKSGRKGAQSRNEANIRIEAPLLKDFTRKYGIPRAQFAWGPREPSPEREPFDEDEAAPPPFVPGAYFKYGGGGQRLTTIGGTPVLANHSRRHPRAVSPPPASESRLKPSTIIKIKVPRRRSLMDFPAEVREHVYRGLLVSNKPIPVYDRWKRVYQREKPGLETSILRTNKQIFLEARRILYGENTFLYRLRDAPNASHVVSDVQELANSDAYVPGTAVASTSAVVFGGPDLPAESEHEPGTINITKYAEHIRYITVQADSNRYSSHTQEFMADAVKMFAREPAKTNIHTLCIIVSPRYLAGKYTFADFFEPSSELVTALRAVSCDTIRIKIWNKYLNNGNGVSCSELVLRTHHLRFFKHLEREKLQGRNDTKRCDIWKGDTKMQRFRFMKLCEINNKLMRLKRSVIKACKKHVHGDIIRRAELENVLWYAEEDEEDWEDWDPQELDYEGSEDDVDQEFQESSDDDNDSDFEG
ncbi:hypothetical protein FHETE_2582 [Fusarium heterosporum]|uniref:Uncharacterized protein n=1 Tax=Fusarium heterosporum TaxID=42747 RepID=A0A8H5WX35_FUSHE|nr:hypothetical protein FHETE_2582 [Fusarium heterosporum]